MYGKFGESRLAEGVSTNRTYPKMVDQLKNGICNDCFCFMGGGG